MNDPMEGFYTPSNLLKKMATYDVIRRELYNQKTGTGMCCFSETDDNELMWAHYTDKYSGICVGYKTTELIKALPKDCHLVKLSYVHIPPTVTASECNSDLKKAARKLLSQKKMSWAYEREWRALGPLALTDLSGEDELVSVVRLGSNIAPENEQYVMRAVTKTDIKVYRMKLSGYGHRWGRVGKKKR